MAIAYGSAGTRFLQGTAGTSWAIPYPSGIAAGDLLVLHVVTNGGGATDPSGWTIIYDEATLANPKGGLWIKVATGSESGTLTFTTSSTTGAAQMFRYTGVDTTTPLDGTPTSVVNSATTNTVVTPSITTTTANTMLVYACGANSGTTTVSSATGTERVDHGSLGGTGARAGALYDEAVAASGATGTRTQTLSAARANWGAMFALRAAGGGGTPGDVTAVVATGTAAAVAATSVTGEATVTSPIAGVTASAPVAVVANNYGAVVATGTAAAPAPAVAGGVGATAPAATVSALAPVPVVTAASTTTAVVATVSTTARPPVIGWGQTATAVVATSSAAALAPTAANNYGAVVATVSVSAPALVATAGWTTVAVRAQATAAALPPTVAVVVGVISPVATVAGAAPVPTVQFGQTVTAVRAQGSSAAVPPTSVAAVVSITSPAATGTAAAPAPTVAGLVSATVVAVRGTANTAAVAPTVAYGVTVVAPRGQVTSLAPAPSIGISPTVQAVRAQGSAGARAPAVTTLINIAPPAATVSALARVPGVAIIAGAVAVPATVSVTAKVPSVEGRRTATTVAVRATGTARGWVPKITASSVVVVPRKNVSVAARAAVVAPGAKFIGRTMTSSLTLSGSPGPVSYLSINGSRTISGNPEGTIPNVVGSLSVVRDHTLPLAATAMSVTAPFALKPGQGVSAFTGSPNVIGTPGLTRSMMGNLGLDGRASIPGLLIQRRCEHHTAYIYDRGGRRQIGALGKLALVKWERKRDDISSAHVVVQSPDKACVDMLELVESARMELVIFRGNVRVWEGPITRAAFRGDRAEIYAQDVMWYVHRTIMMHEYDNRYPNNGPVIDRIQRVMLAEVSRLEAQDPSVNVLNHVQYIRATTPGVEDAGTAAHTVPFEMSVFEHIDTYAARGGLDYTVTGRSILYFDVHQKIGQTAMVTRDDFIGDPIITQYGSEVATYVAMTDGKGNWGEAGGDDPYYGRLEVLHQAYDENAGPAETNQPPSVAEMTSQARRAYNAAKVPPTVVRVPDGTRINPNGALGDVTMLVPGVYIPLNAKLPGRSVTQMQKLDNMTVEETPENGEIIQVTLSPATTEVFVED